jgi:hypothetical protein
VVRQAACWFPVVPNGPVQPVLPELPLLPAVDPDPDPEPEEVLALAAAALLLPADEPLVDPRLLPDAPEVDPLEAALAAALEALKPPLDDALLEALESPVDPVVLPRLPAAIEPLPTVVPTLVLPVGERCGLTTSSQPESSRTARVAAGRRQAGMGEA